MRFSSAPERSGFSEFSLRDVFRLRMLPTLNGRRVRARIFKRNERYGLLDSSGAIWPVRILGDIGNAELWSRVECCQRSPLVPGEILGFELTYQEDFSAGKDSYLVSRMERWLHSEAAEGVWATVHSHCFQSAFAAASAFPELANHQLLHRAKDAVRKFFLARGYLELEAPLLVESGGLERYLGLFETEYVGSQGVHRTFQLPTSPEFALKKLLARGYPRVFSLAPSFRNWGEHSPWHRPEFTMLEWYTAGQTIDALVRQTLELARCLEESLGLKRTIKVGEVPVMRIEDLYLDYFKIDLREYFSSGRKDDLFFALKEQSVSVNATDSLDDLFWKSFLDVIEPQVLKHRGPVILTGFPIGYASLANPAPDGVFAERFELFMDGVEICNGYHELTDACVARERFYALQQERAELRRDPDFEDSLDCGIGRCSGNALGLERLLSCLADHDQLAYGSGLRPFGSE